MKEDKILLRDGNWNEFYLDKAEYRKNVLPINIGRFWDNPDELFKLLVSNSDDFHDALESAANRLLEIDYDKERSYGVLSSILIRNNKKHEARELLSNYLENNPKSARILTNIAVAMESDIDVIKIARKAAELDPNFPNAIVLYLFATRKVEGEKKHDESLNELVKLKGAWYPKIYKMHQLLSENKVPEALVLSRKAIKISKADNIALLHISAGLSDWGFFQEIIDEVLPYVSHDQPSLDLIESILIAFSRLDKHKESLDFVYKLRVESSKNMNEVEAFYLKNMLKDYEDSFSKSYSLFERIKKFFKY